MRIASSNVAGRSATASIEHKSASETLEIYQNGQLKSSFRHAEEETRVKQSGTLFLDGQRGGNAGLEELGASRVGGPNKLKSARRKLDELEELRFKALQEALRTFRRRWTPFRNVFRERDGGLSAQRPAGASGFQYAAEQTRYEYERMDFSMKGKAVTEDGRTIEFDIELSMSREFYERSGFAMSAFAEANVRDPLMIQLSGMPSLTEAKFSFDLDMDGSPDQISFAGEGAGFLALDKDGNGRIDDGSELFGPKTGDGFAELAEYDSDNNGWIDENDPIFDRLRVWTKDQNGSDRLMALGEAGVGAIYLDNFETEYQMKNRANELQGIMRSSGMFLFEDGGAGTMHQVDLVQ